jgi:hypothetical protein
MLCPCKSSSVDVKTAHRFGMTLIGFLRGDRFNVYNPLAPVTPAVLPPVPLLNESLLP